jgi:hypothetical protein
MSPANTMYKKQAQKFIKDKIKCFPFFLVKFAFIPFYFQEKKKTALASIKSGRTKIQQASHVLTFIV